MIRPSRSPLVPARFLAAIVLAAAPSLPATPATPPPSPASTRHEGATARAPKARERRHGSRPISIDDLIEARVPADLDLSPDGARLAYTVRTYDEARARYVHQVHLFRLPDGPDRQYTYREGGAAAPRFSPDGARLAFLAGPDDPSEDEEEGGASSLDEPSPQLFVMRVDGGEAVQATRLQAGVEAFRWLPDGTGLVVLTEEETSAPERALKSEREEARDDGTVELANRRRQQFWSIALEDGGARRLHPGVLGIEPPFDISPDGRSIVYAANLTAAPGGDNDYDLFVLDLPTGAVRRLTDRKGAEKAPVVSPDGRQVAFVAPASPDVSFSRATLFVVPLAGGTPRDLSGRTDRDLDQESDPAFTPDGRAVLAVVHRGTDGPIWRFDLAAGEGREIVGGTRVCSHLAVGRKGILGFVEEGPAAPPDIHVASLDGSGNRKVTDLLPESRDWKAGESSIVRWKSFDGKEVEGILVKPPGYKGGTRLPLLVYPHGGPQWRDPNILLDDRQAYAAQGYAVLLPQFRGSTGYGDVWARASMKDLGGGDFRDLMAGVDHLVATGVADPARLGIFGGSYGGYLTNWAITQTDRFKGAVSWYGIWNLVTDFSNSFYTEWEPDYLRTHYWDDWEAYLSRSPARFVKKVTTPVLILHGEADDNTSLANSHEMWTALRALGKQVEFVHYPREGHGFSEPAHLRDVFERTLRHMDRYVKEGRSEEARQGDTVTSGGLELLVAGIERRDDFAGRTPRENSIFVEVTLILKDPRPKPGRLSLRIGGSASEVRLVDPSGRSISALGTLAPTLGEDLLFAGEGELQVVPDENGEPHTLPAVLVFEVPDAPGRCRLRVKEFRSVVFDLPLERRSG
jgi:dipeptidyl aminopeptidase/acylaminoacyl peptidase